MFFVLLVVLLVGAVVVIYSLRSLRGSDPLLLSNRMGRFGLSLAPSNGQSADAVGRMIAPGRERQQENAVAKSVERVIGRGKFGNAIYVRLERAHVKMTVGEFITITMAITLGGMALGLLVKGYLGMAILGVVAGCAPWFYLGHRLKKRRKKFIEQLADMAQMIGNSLKAGFSIMQSMELVSTDAPAPACEEFERVVTEVKLGLPLETGLEHLKERMPSEDIELMVVAISVQRQIGGNLSEILMVISQTIRERVRFERDLRTLTAQARYSSYIITALPVAVAFIINLMDPSYESFLYKNIIGNVMIGIAVTMLAMGFFFLRRIANIEV